MCITTGLWDSASCVGKLVFFSPSHDGFRVTLTVGQAGGQTLVSGDKLLLGMPNAPDGFDSTGARGSVQSSYAGTGATLKLESGRLCVRVDASEQPAFWAECMLPEGDVNV